LISGSTTRRQSCSLQATLPGENAEKAKQEQRK